MRARSLATILIALSIAGCAGKQDVESLKQRVQADEEMFMAERQKNDAARTELQAAISGLQIKLAAMENEKAAVAQQLADRTAELEQKTVEASQLRNELDSRKKTAADKRTQQALANAKKAALPADHPFRVFDVLFVGRQTHNGQTCDYGMFSVRNYTAEPLKVTANYAVNVTIPPNSSQSGIYVPASKNSPLHISTPLGSKECSWEN